jgi:hypothetical protein
VRGLHIVVKRNGERKSVKRNAKLSSWAAQPQSKPQPNGRELRTL